MNHRESRHKSAPRRDPAKGGERPAKLPSNQLWLYGAHAVLAALANKERKIRRIVLTAEALRSHAASIQRARALRPLPGEETTERQELDRLLPPAPCTRGSPFWPSTWTVPASRTSAGWRKIVITRW